MPKLFGNTQRRNTARRSANVERETTPVNSEPCPGERFAAHISKYTGQTVTVFVRSGGQSGIGFTGILIYAGSTYIKLVTRIGPPPAYPFMNPCFRRLFRIHHLGSITCIPTDKIASFVHNAV